MNVKQHRLLILFLLSAFLLSCTEPEKKTPPVKKVLYTGIVKHVFFHPLIIEKKNSFKKRSDNDFSYTHNWLILASEYTPTLQELYNAGYRMIDYYDTVKQNPDGTFSKKELHLPEGVKPMVVSIDDLNYNPIHYRNGTSRRLKYDSNGFYGCISFTEENGRQKCNREKQNIISLTEAFVKKYPDFAINGGRPIIAFTGYKNLLGYPIHDKDFKGSEQEKELKAIIQKLKDHKYRFASHGYSHLQSEKVSYDRFKRDTLRWDEKIRPYLGKVDIYIYPFGERVTPGSAKFKLMLEYGFRHFQGVHYRDRFEVQNRSYGNYVYMHRLPLDGLYLRRKYIRRDFKPIFNVDAVIDKERKEKFAEYLMY